MKNDRAQELIRSLGLLPHPEGGHYREIYRSVSEVNYPQEKKRAALTTIYFLLESGQVSRWHVVDADEVWHFYEGAPLELFIMPPDFSTVKKIMLGEVDESTRPVHVVPAGWWQAAKPSGAYALCGCTVAPGFEFSGFRFLDEKESAAVGEKFPSSGDLL